MTDVLEAVYNIVTQNNFKIRALYSGRNRAKIKLKVLIFQKLK